MRTTLFIADLHLSETTPAITDCFLRFLETEASQAEALYILGDLFEYWVGDDDNSDYFWSIKQALKALVERGVYCAFINGNRDLLIGHRFEQQTGVKVLPQETLIDLYGRPTLLLHGDTLCIDDVAYQAYRAKVHNPRNQRIYYWLPLWLRRRLVAKIRAKSKQGKQQKSAEIMDVNEAEVARVLRQYHMPLMIHGHTHRPAIHQIELDEQTTQRIVLGDWYTQGSVLRVTEQGVALEQLAFKK
ncbi:UDP-2,3-diacylglucosamine hydrolase [Vibrio stylophorae]|uniref:UDP-2,3-diacylglucosamine hydrolase n=1 Tax=Vibrio stylophorae TaxID=659351 RepID=A0ABM8ZUQ3_9VIBR|nr:UDP-2,3-diacylglucosamine diphosphatase [Vibrio stylophorae]CAH0534056.1 UDP-2,3-diacylglucosamine hydrolase [Vibrio stylophorae]